MSAALLQVANLRCVIGGGQVVENVSFDVPAKGVTALLGRNGAGKTSILRGILGLIQRQGSIRFDGSQIETMMTHRIVQRGIGFVPEDREVFAGLSVAENLALAERQTNPHRAFVNDLFPDLVARRDQLAGTLSGGQQQMVAIARALINDNRLLLVDEPTKGLAPKIVGEVTRALRLASERVPMLLVEQNLEVVRQLADDAIVISAGNVVHTGKAKDLLSDDALTTRLLGVHTESGHEPTGRKQ